MKAYILDGGSLVLDKSFMLWNHGQGVIVRFPVFSLLIEHKEGNILFDTGFDKNLVEKYLPFEEPLQDKEQTLPAQLKKAGFELKDIHYVINSHLHFDHCGGNKLIPDATFIVHKEELRHAYVPEPFGKLGYFREDFDFDGVKYDLIEGDLEIFKGVHLVYTPGHTVGHYSIYLELQEDPFIYTADASFGPENIEKKHPMGLHLDPIAMLASMHKIKYLSKNKGAQILFSHDPSLYSSYKKVPEFYK
jgi:4-pyridoxolactonase